MTIDRDLNRFTPIPSFDMDIPSFDDASLLTGVDNRYGFNSFTPIPDIGGTTSPNLSGRFSSFLSGRGGGNIAGGIQGIGALLQGIGGLKQYGLGKDIFRKNAALTNREIADRATLINAQTGDRELRKAAQRSDLAGDFAAIQKAAELETEKRRISGEPV